MIDLDLVKISKRHGILPPRHRGLKYILMRNKLLANDQKRWLAGGLDAPKKGPKFSRAYDDKFQKWIQIQLQTNFHVGFKE